MWCGLRKHMPLGDICITSPADVQFNCNLRDKLKLFPAANIHTHASLANSFFFHATHSERKVQYHFLLKHPIPLTASSAFTQYFGQLVLLPTAREGNVFTGVCLSTIGLMLLAHCSAFLQCVRILLECFLVI